MRIKYPEVCTSREDKMERRFDMIWLGQFDQKKEPDEKIAEVSNTKAAETNGPSEISSAKVKEQRDVV